MYIKFDQKAHADVHREFLSELASYKNDATCQRLHSYLINRKLHLIMNIYTSSDVRITLGYRLVMISCYVDNILVKLAKESGFPRGFPLLWVRGEYIQMYGFYPKFENDVQSLVIPISIVVFLVR